MHPVSTGSSLDLVGYVEGKDHNPGIFLFPVLAGDDAKFQALCARMRRINPADDPVLCLAGSDGEADIVEKILPVIRKQIADCSLTGRVPGRCQEIRAGSVFPEYGAVGISKKNQHRQRI